MERLAIGQENLHCSVRTVRIELDLAQGRPLTNAQQEPTACALCVDTARIVFRFWHLASVRREYRRLAGAQPRFHGGIPRCSPCFAMLLQILAVKSALCSGLPPCDLLDELNPRLCWDAFTRAGTLARHGFSITNARGAYNVPDLRNRAHAPCRAGIDPQDRSIIILKAAGIMMIDSFLGVMRHDAVIISPSELDLGLVLKTRIPNAKKEDLSQSAKTPTRWTASSKALPVTTVLLPVYPRIYSHVCF